MSKSKTPMYLGLAAAGAGGYYLYKAGGDPKTATKDMKGESSSVSLDSRGKKTDMLRNNKTTPTE